MLRVVRDDNTPDYTLADLIQFDHAIIDMLRDETSAVFSQLIPNENRFADTPDEPIESPYKGLTFACEQERADAMISELKDSLRERGYLIFKSDKNYGRQPDVVSVIKSDDQFDILRCQATDGANHNIDNDDVIAKVQAWHQLYPLQIIGADIDWMEAEFIQQPEDLQAFAQEVYEFCPDVVEQGTQTVERLAEAMDVLNVLYLWWD